MNAKPAHRKSFKLNLEQMDKDVLRDLIDTSLMVQRAKDLDISVETDIVRELDDIRQQNNLPDMEAFQKAVETEGFDWEEFKNNIRKHLLVQEVMSREVASKLNIDATDMQKYYDAHKDLFQRPEMVYVREIFVSTKDKPEADIPKLKAKAEDLRQRVLENGDDFGELAKHFSDGSTAKQGGELGSFQPGQLNADYAQVFKLDRNEMTPVIANKTDRVCRVCRSKSATKLACSQWIKWAEKSRAASPTNGSSPRNASTAMHCAKTVTSGSIQAMWIPPELRALRSSPKKLRLRIRNRRMKTPTRRNAKNF